MIGTSEEITALADSLAPSQHGSDRQAAHYYRAMHARAVEREQQWQQKARSGERIIAALVYLVGLLLREIGELKRQLAWLNKQQFGRKSEKSPQHPPSTAAPAGNGPVPASGTEAGIGQVLCLFSGLAHHVLSYNTGVHPTYCRRNPFLRSC